MKRLRLSSFFPGKRRSDASKMDEGAMYSTVCMQLKQPLSGKLQLTCSGEIWSKKRWWAVGDPELPTNVTPIRLTFLARS